MRPRTKLKNIDVREISLVDRGANEGARVLFMKRLEDERNDEKNAEYVALEAYVKKHPWDNYKRKQLEDFWPRIDEPKQERVSPMTITKHEEPPVRSAVDINKLANMTIDALAHQIRKANPHLTSAQAFEKAYRDNPYLARAERNSHYAAIGAEYRIEEPVSKSETDGTKFNERVAELVKRGMPRNNAFDEVAKALLTGARETTPRERAFREVAQASLPEMMSLKPRDLGNYETGRSMTPGLDEGWPSEKSIAELYDEMQRAGRDGKNFDRAAAAYMAAQQRVEQAAREAAGVRSFGLSFPGRDWLRHARVRQGADG